MSNTKIIFSPTGGTKKCADIVSTALGGEWNTIDLTDPQFDASQYSFALEDVVVIAVPSFGGRVPDIAVKQIKLLKGNRARAILLCAFGNRAYDDTLLELRNAAMDAGFSCYAALSAVAQHSIMPQFGANRPDEADIQELTEFAKQINEKLGQPLFEDLNVPGNAAYREYNGVPLKPKANSSCKKCGLCAQKCPVQAIDPLHPKKTDVDKCISCMQCVAICPQKARNVSKLKVGLAAFKMKKNCHDRKANELYL